jgi:ribonucleoside-diphosphate reductase alpha chain
MDNTNISVILDDAFFAAYARGDGLATMVFNATVRHACETGDPGFSVDCGENEGENLRNACTEVTSRDDSDICNLASINLARIGSLSEFRETVEIASAFLVAGTVYSDVPYARVADVRTKNRRLGLGLMGMHEMLARGGEPYGTVPRGLLEIYANSGFYARGWANRWGLSTPVKTRAIAPTGTIGIVAETTTGIEPIFCAAYKRRYFDHGTWRTQYVVDPTARRLVDEGMSPDAVEDAYTIEPERRVSFQADLQRYVDHGISSTINLPAWGSATNNQDTIGAFGDMLMKYLPRLRGITCYPDGARGGQPLTRVAYSEAIAREGEVLTEQADVCDLRGGSCGA